ncbi:MAG: cysteine protease [Proteobacteria bacterium]|nr:cysteine protease [Pseudomonadota bacterium]MBU1057192.1 cysteine protease [Pseudomonadota bacterium]
MNRLYTEVTLSSTGEKVGTGWLPPMPDLRDYTDQEPEIAKMTKKLGLTASQKKKAVLPEKVDLLPWCSPVENQASLGSCTANAAVGIIEYFQRRAFNKHLDGSRLFIYKTTRNLMQVTGDTGAWLRNTMGALALCGVPEEKYWPYTDVSPDFDKEPPNFVYAVADNFEALRYFCHDPLGANISGKEVLSKVKIFLSAGVPSMFGFFGFPSFNNNTAPGEIPYPCPGEQAEWGHAIMAVGYDDKKEIHNPLCDQTTTGALLIRNSWGPDWGNAGYGWLPYDYVTNKLALDFWSLLSMEWVDTKQFGI